MPQRKLFVLGLIGLLLSLASNSATAQVPTCAYVANNLSNNVSAYTIDGTGKLGSVPGSPFAVVGLPSSVAADPAGQHLYVANSVLSNSLWVTAFAIGPDCALADRMDFPPSSSDLLQPIALAVHPSGNLLYMASVVGGVRCFTIPGFQPCGTAPAGTFPSSIVLDPTGRFAYVTEQSLSVVFGYAINLPSGGLTPMAGSPFADNCSSPGACVPMAIALDPLGRFADVANSDRTICVYTVDANSGNLSPRPPPCLLEQNVNVAFFTWVTAHPSGNFVLASAPAFAGAPGFATVYRVGSNGDLSEIGSFPAGTDPSSITVDSSGQFVYVTNQTSNNISCYTIDSTNGFLTKFDCIDSQTGAHPVSIITTGTLPHPVVTLSAAKLTFAKTPIGQTSPSKSITLSNTGNATLNISSITISGDFIIQKNTCGAQVLAGANCKVTMAFKPTAKGVRKGTLTFTDDAANSPQTVALTGTGQSLALSPNPVNYGTVVVGQSSTMAVTVKNVSNAMVSLTGFSITGAITDYSITANTCGATLNAGANCSISVKFAPSVKGKRSGTLNVFNNGGGSDSTDKLVGTGG